jgi:hypothetical protein
MYRIILYFSILLHCIVQWVLQVVLHERNKQQEKASIQTHTQETEENRTGKHKWKRAKCNHVQVKPTKQIPS